MGFKVNGDRYRVDDRVTPVVEADELGQQLGAQPVPIARDGVDSEVAGHRQLPSVLVTGSTNGVAAKDP